MTISIDKDVVSETKKQTSDQMKKVAEMMMVQEKVGEAEKI